MRWIAAMVGLLSLLALPGYGLVEARTLREIPRVGFVPVIADDDH